MAIELYESKPLQWMETEKTVRGTIWLQVELITFCGVLVSNMIFMTIRSCRQVQTKIDMMDKRKQLPATDTLEAYMNLLQQYQSFFVPVCVLFFLTS